MNQTVETSAVTVSVEPSQPQAVALRQPSQDSIQTLAMIERAVSSKSVDVDKMRALLDMKKEMMQAEQELIFK